MLDQANLAKWQRCGWDEHTFQRVILSLNESLVIGIDAPGVQTHDSRHERAKLFMIRDFPVRKATSRR